MSASLVFESLIVGFLGAAVSYTRLTRNFPDAPLKAALTPPGGLYLGVNVVISWVTFLLVMKTDMRFGLGSGASTFSLALARVFAAGLGAPLLLQSSLASVRIGELNLDPGDFVNSILQQISFAVDRRQAVGRLGRDYLNGLDFDRDCGLLVELVSNALQIQLVDSDAPGDFGERMGKLSARTDLPMPVKLRLLQFELVNRAGDKAVRAAALCLQETWRAQDTMDSNPSTNTHSLPLDLSVVERGDAADLP